MRRPRPVLYSADDSMGGSLFEYLQNDLITVEIHSGKPSR